MTPIKRGTARRLGLNRPAPMAERDIAKAIGQTVDQAVAGVKHLSELLSVEMSRAVLQGLPQPPRKTRSQS
jgi:hypothetical protein